jgi:peptidoglycan hydrolase-like protein with peptidoglycan-binding domain
VTDVLQYPDIASYEAGISLAGLAAVCVKATEDGGNAGNRYENPDFPRARADAARLGVLLTAYHFLRKDNPAGEADYARSVIGAGTPTMVDAEASGVTVGDILAFGGEYNAKGGRLALAYLPHWYWQDTLGSPDLRPLSAAGIHLVSSNYPAAGYSDNGPGWAQYGGVTPLIWQWTDRAQVNGHTVDMNAFKGTAAQLAAALRVDAPPPPSGPRVLVEGDVGSDVAHLQLLLATAGYDPGPRDSDFGPRTLAAVQDFQRDHLAACRWVDGQAGPLTMAALQAAAANPDPWPGVYLKRSSTGALVKRVQAALKRSGYDPGPLDGDFGKNTAAEVYAYQHARPAACGPADAVVGPRTWRSLRP